MNEKFYASSSWPKTIINVQEKYIHKLVRADITAIRAPERIRGTIIADSGLS